MDVLTLSLVLTAILAGSALAFSVYRLVRIVRTSREASTTMIDSMRIYLPTAGRKTLYIEGPRLARISKLSLSMKDAQGNPVALSKILIPMKISGLSTVRRSFANCELASAGDYLLEASGIPDAKNMAVHFYRRNTLVIVGWILAVVFSGCATMGSLLALGILHKG